MFLFRVSNFSARSSGHQSIGCSEKRSSLPFPDSRKWSGSVKILRGSRETSAGRTATSDGTRHIFECRFKYGDSLEPVPLHQVRDAATYLDKTFPIYSWCISFLFTLFLSAARMLLLMSLPAAMYALGHFYFSRFFSLSRSLARECASLLLLYIYTHFILSLVPLVPFGAFLHRTPRFSHSHFSVVSLGCYKITLGSGIGSAA